jgi:hypothetical protein
MANGIAILTIDPIRGIVVAAGSGPPSASFLPGEGSIYTDYTTGNVYSLGSSWAQLGAAGSTAWTSVTGTPTTLGGYGITDAYTKTASDARYQPIGTYQTPQTTLAGYGITDAYTKTASDARYQPIGTYQTPQTTLGGYGITDAYTKTASDARYLQLSGGTLTGALDGTSAAFSGGATLGGQQAATVAFGSSAPTSSTPGVVGTIYVVT